MNDSRPSPPFSIALFAALLPRRKKGRTSAGSRYTGLWIFLALAISATSLSSVAYAGAGVWTSSGPYNGGPYGGPWDGSAQALAIDPTNSTTLYLGAKDDGVFKSTDSGGTWAAANTGLTNLNVRALAINPLTPTTLYAGTYYGDGVFKSTDSGGTWAAANTGLDNRGVYALAINPTTPATLYAGTEDGVFKSVDSGDIWAATGLRGYAEALAINPVTPTTLYAGTNLGVFKSTDSGGTWFAMGLPKGVSALAINPTTPTTLYAGTYGDGVFRSTDSGGTWAAVNRGVTNLNLYVLAINPTTPTTLYAGTYGGGAFKSTDSGGTWAPANTGLTSLYVQALAINPTTPSTLYAGAVNYGVKSIGGVFKSTDSGITWAPPDAPRWPLSVNALAINPTTSTTLYAGTDYGVFRSTDSGGTWAVTGPGNVNALAINPTTSTTLYAGTEYNGVFRSIDSGGTWHDASTGLTSRSGVNALAINPTAPTMLYAGTKYDGVYRSTNSGGTWVDANSGLNSQEVNALAINPTTPSTLYAAMAYWGVFKSNNSGGTWTAVNTGLPPDFANCPYYPYMCPNFYALAINPTTPSTLYAGVFGGATYSGPWYGGLFKSADSGGTWAAGNTGLGNRTVYALAISPTTPATLYAGTAYGVFKSTDSGGAWAAANTGLPNLSVQALALDPTGATTVYAGLQNGGVWQFTPSTGTPACTIGCSASAPSTGQTGQSLSFTSSATPSNCSGSVSYSWDFGDGYTSGSQNPSHGYSSAGTYSWTLTASVGSTQCQKTGSVTITTPSTCTISCSASAPSTGQTGQSLSFASSATPSNCSGSINYSWNFGDGQTSGSQNPSHSYANAGTYSWTLTASIGSTQCQKTGTISIATAGGGGPAPFLQQGPKLVGTGAAGNAFQGGSVSVSADGNTAIVGGAVDNSRVGAAWVWTRSGGVWTQQGAKLVGSGSVGSAVQGASVSLSADGNTAIVGGSGDNGGVGAAWVWTRSGGVWSQQGPKLIGSGAVGNAFQGASVSLSADGNTAVVGGHGDSALAGAVWVWTRSGGVWTQQGPKLVGSGAVGAARQGGSVSLSADGNTAIVGGSGDNGYPSGVGATWVWTRSGGVWTQQGSKLVGSGAVGNASQGGNVSLSADGNTAIVAGAGGPSGVGATWVWTRSGGIWTQQGSKLVDSGGAAALSGDGNTAVVGGSGDNGGVGAAWIWTRSGGVWTQQGAKLVGSGAVGNAAQGAFVSLSADGNTAIVGGYQDNSNAGAAWVFTRAANPPQSGSWVLPSSAFRGGVNGAEFHTDVRILNLGKSAVTVTATLYDQASGTTVSAPGFPVAGRSQASFDNVLQSLFGKTLANGSYGPIRFDSTGPITVSSSVNNVNACGTGATSGQWLPGINTTNAMTAGLIAQLAVSTSTSAGYRTNLVVMNPGSANATATVRVRAGGGVLLSTGTIGPLGPNGFSQVPLDSSDTFPGVAGRTDSNLWVEFTSNQPVLAFASVVNNASGDPFAVVATPDSGGGASGSWVLPSSAFRGGVNGAEFHTDVRILNLGSSAVTVTATLYDQASGTTVSASGFPVAGRSQASFDNVLQSLFGKTLSNGSYGPIRFDSTGPITVSSSVNNVNACGTGATSGQWLPGIHTTDTMTAGAIAQLAVSASTSAGYRTNLVVMNPGSANATATVKVRAGGGVLLSTGTIGPLGPNGFSQVPLDSSDTFPGVAGRTDSNLWVEFTSNQPVLAFASVVNNASGDPFAVVATPDAGGR